LRSRLLGKDYKLIYDESRFSLLKLILNRNRKENEMEIKPELADTNDPAYNCGRLLSVLAETQKKAHDYKLEGAGVVERYFATAGVSPSSVFPLLLRLNRHHLNKIRKSEKWSGGERFLEEQIRTIAAKFKSRGDGCPPVFPRILDLQAQGRFALGFYQQQAADALARTDAKEAKANAKTENKPTELSTTEPQLDF
jgi:CRISPR-associated protein Csd1